MRGFWATATAIAALMLIGASQALAAGTVNVTINGVGTVRGSVVASGAELELHEATPPACSPARARCSSPTNASAKGDPAPARAPRSRRASPCPGQLDLYAADSGALRLHALERRPLPGTGRDCTIVMPVAAPTRTRSTANFGDNAPPSVALTAPGSGYVRGAVTVAAERERQLRRRPASSSHSAARRTGATGAPFAATFDSAQLPDGPASATARATDVNGHASATAATTVTVDNTAPTLDVSGPSNRTFAPGSTQAGSWRRATPPPASRRCSAAWWRPARRRASARARAPDGRDRRQPAARRVSLHGPRDRQRGQRLRGDARLHDRRHARGRGRRQRRQAARQRRQRLGRGSAERAAGHADATASTPSAAARASPRSRSSASRAARRSASRARRAARARPTSPPSRRARSASSPICAAG